LGIDAGDNERKVTEERVKFIDSLTPSPEQRAKKVFDIIDKHNKSLYSEQLQTLEKVDNWDILCYCVTHMISLVNVYSWLSLPAKHLKFLVFNAHYLYPKGHGVIKDA
jgi:hypothetical protein